MHVQCFFVGDSGMKHHYREHQITQNQVSLVVQPNITHEHNALCHTLHARAGICLRLMNLDHPVHNGDIPASDLENEDLTSLDRVLLEQRQSV